MQRLSQVVSRVGLKKSEIYRRIAKGEFPAPAPLGVAPEYGQSTRLTFRSGTGSP